jgi:ABC-2 type transport system ATP-binding protein
MEPRRATPPAAAFHAAGDAPCDVPPAIDARDVAYHYGRQRHAALCDVSLRIAAGEIFVLLGPNGGGKTTLFRLLATLVPLQRGEIRVLGYDVRRQAGAARRHLGVVFQAPSLDRKLTVAENLRFQGYLYGLSGPVLRRRSQEMLEQLGVADRAADRVETLSGGLRRRVELAKALLHAPPLLLMDEPSTGLDPAARSDLWNYLRTLRAQRGVTVLLTTHLLEEADRADRIAILDRGRIVALGPPDQLRSELGGDTLSLQARDPHRLAEEIRRRFAAALPAAVQVVNNTVRWQHREAHRLVPQIMESLADQVQAVTVSKPSLEDVFIARTGHRFWQAADAEDEADTTQADPAPPCITQSDATAGHTV